MHMLNRECRGTSDISWLMLPSMSRISSDIHIVLIAGVENSVLFLLEENVWESEINRIAFVDFCATKILHRKSLQYICLKGT